MELNDFKSAWKSDSGNINITQNQLKEIVGRRDYGPVAVLKKNFGRNLLLSALVAVNFTIKNLGPYHNDVLCWLFIGLCVLMDVYYVYAYNVLDDMQNFYNPVISTIKRQMIILQRCSAIHLAVLQAMPVAFAVVLEILLYHHQEPFFHSWYQLPVEVRVIGYATLAGLFYALKVYVHERSFARHILYLKDLVNQLD